MSQAISNSNKFSLPGKQPTQLNIDLINLTTMELCRLFIDRHCRARPDLARPYLAELIYRQDQNQDTGKAQGQAGPPPAPAANDDAGEPPQTPPGLDRWGQDDRSEAIQAWLKRINETIVTLNHLWDLLADALILDPDQVEALELVRLTEAVKDDIADLPTDLGHSDFDGFIELVIGRDPTPYQIEFIIETGRNLAHIQREIDDIRLSDPAAADRLQSLLRTEQGGGS